MSIYCLCSDFKTNSAIKKGVAIFKVVRSIKRWDSSRNWIYFRGEWWSERRGESWELVSGIQVVRVKDKGRTDIQETWPQWREVLGWMKALGHWRKGKGVTNLAKDNGMDSCEEMNIEGFTPWFHLSCKKIIFRQFCLLALLPMIFIPWFLCPLKIWLWMAKPEVCLACHRLGALFLSDWQRSGNGCDWLLF